MTTSRCEYSGRLAPDVTLDADHRIICGCERRIRVRPDGRIAPHLRKPQMFRPTAAATQRPSAAAVAVAAGCWATDCDGPVIAKRMCWRHYRRLIRLNIGPAPRPPGRPLTG